MDRSARANPPRARGARPRRACVAGGLVAVLLAVSLASGCDSSDDDDDADAAPELLADPPLSRLDVRGTDELRPWRATSPWAEALPGCAIVDAPFAACTLETLPFIAQATPEPTVEDVLDRTLVTHGWMGERFERFLRQAPPELVGMFGAVTSISIGSTVRPSNYWIGTGAVQLDPADLWLTNAEKRTIAVDEDFRAPFGRVLAFRNEWAQRLDGRPIGTRAGLEGREERAFEDVVLPFASVVYHELAHANDFLPPGEAAGLDPALRPLDALSGIADRWLSTRLVQQLPLRSLILQRLARVRFLGEPPTASEAAIGPTVAGAAMDGDGAMLFYGYTTIHEDFASLVEGALMKARHGVDTHVGFTDRPVDPEAVRCADLVVGWGVRNRLGDGAVNARARLALAELFPDDLDLLDAVGGALGTAEPMAPGTNWCENVGGTGRDPEPELDPAPTNVSPPASVVPRGLVEPFAAVSDREPARAARAIGSDAVPHVEPVPHSERHARVEARRRSAGR